MIARIALVALALVLSGCDWLFGASIDPWTITKADRHWCPPIGTSLWNDNDGGIWWIQDGARVSVPRPYTLTKGSRCAATSAG